MIDAAGHVSVFRVLLVVGSVSGVNVEVCYMNLL